MDAVAMRRSDGWYSTFAILMALSVVVATMGLSLNSAAVVIGAMLLAPLMTPVLGVAAALAMALPRHLGRSAAVVVAASVGAVALAWVLSIPLGSASLPDELVARTSPDLRDLLVALAAGAAGAYATVRPNLSSALPGVAVAVALVPPLAAVGMTLELGRGDLAAGAALLYLANLAAIVLVGTVVFVVTGFVPVTRLRNARGAVIGGGVLVAVATVAVAVPLAIASIAAADAGRERAEVLTAASAWIAGTNLEVDSVRVDRPVVRIRISGPDTPPSTVGLEDQVREIVGSDATVEVRWTLTQAADLDSTVAIGDLDGGQVRPVVDVWLDGAAGDPDVTGISTDGGTITVELTASDPPPPAGALIGLLAAAGINAPVAVDWTQRDDPQARVAAQARAAAESWAAGIPGVVVVGVDFDGTTVTANVAGPDANTVSGLSSVLARSTPAGTTVEIFLIPRVSVTVADPDAAGS